MVGGLCVCVLWVKANSAELGLWGVCRGRVCVMYMRAGHLGEVSEAGSEVAVSPGGECRRCAAGRCIVYAGVCVCVGVCLGGCHRVYVSVSGCLCH